MNKHHFFLIFAMTCCFGASAHVRAAEPGRTERHVTVQGQGKVSAVPDQARLWIQVSEEGARVEAVTQQVRQKMEAVLKAVKAQGIADKDIQTQYYRVAPKMDWKNNRATRIGFTVSNQIEVKIRDLKKTGSLLAAVEDAGANDINGPQFEFENPRALEHKALALALEEAKTKAALLAQTAGATLGDVISIDEGGSFSPGPRPMVARMAMQSAAPAREEPIATGEETVQATVSARFALK